MHPQAIDKYLEQLQEVKERGNVFVAFSRGTCNAIYDEATVEVTTLQLRRILELLAFGFVLATGEKAIPAYASFVRYKNVTEFFSRLRKLNEDYYPQPIVQERNEQGEMHWNDPAPSEYLTREDFATLLEHCDRVLEPRRVGATPMSLEQCKAANKRWYNKIVRLLDAHLIHPPGKDIAYLFQMESPDADPTCHTFKLIDDEGKLSRNHGTKTSKQKVAPTLIDHLRRQLEYLNRSSELYDAGHLDEAIRLAVTIRVLMHDTKNSKSLLQQMRIKDQVRLATSFGLSQKLPAHFQPASVLPLFASSSEGGTFAPFTLADPPILLTPSEWWDEMVWKQEHALTRRDIVLETANKEGGAHVQAVATPIVQELRQGLSQIKSVKVNGVEVGTPENYHFILIRQFAYELLNSKSLTALAG